VVDTGPLIELLSGTSLGLRFEEKVLRDDAVLYMSETAVSEVCYILCRQLGVAEAMRKMKILLDASLSDCFTIAAAKKRSST